MVDEFNRIIRRKTLKLKHFLRNIHGKDTKQDFREMWQMECGAHDGHTKAPTIIYAFKKEKENTTNQCEIKSLSWDISTNIIYSPKIPIDTMWSLERFDSYLHVCRYNKHFLHEWDS